MNLIKKITENGIKDGMSFVHRKKIYLVNSISFFAGILLSLFSLYFSTLDPPTLALCTLFFCTAVYLGTSVITRFFGTDISLFVFFISSQFTILIIGSYISNDTLPYQLATYVWLGTSFSVVFAMFDMRNKIKNIVKLLITIFCALLVPQSDTFFNSIAFASSIQAQPHFLVFNFFVALFLNIVILFFCQNSYSEYFLELMHNLKAKNRQLEEKESELSKSLKQLRTSQLELNKSYDLLKEKQDQLEALASNVPGVIFNMEIFQNAIVNFKYVSPRAFEFFECEEVDIMLNANLLLDQIMPEFRKDIYADLLSNHKETSQIAPEFKILTPKGQEKWLKAEMLISPTNNKTKQINGVFLDISEEKKQETIKEKIRESLLNIPNDDCIVSGDILKALKLITDTAKDTLGVNSVSIWLLDKEPTPQLLCYEHTSDKEFDYAREPLSLSEIELFLTTLEKDKVVVADDAHSHPVTKELYAHNLRPAFIKSTLDADIILKGTFQGVICCGHSSKRHWAQDEVQYLNSLSDIISLALEIHERKKTESEIQRAYSLIISVFDAVEEGLMVVGSDHETLECNNRFIEMFKVPPALLNKENRRLRIRYIADQLINGDDFMEKLSSMEASNEHEFFNVLHLRDKRAIEQFSQPFYVQGKFMGRIWSYRDITKSLQAEESLRTVNSELDTFIYRASHDIKGPLARLRGICDVAKMTIKDAQANVYLKLLDLESRKLDSILEKLLVVKDLKTNNIKIEKINFNEVLDKSIKHLKYVQDFENIHIKVQVDNTLEFKSDGNLLELVFMNLIDNAIQFRDENKPSTNISIDIYPENNFVTVCIKDNGIGMEETILNQIFDMHFRGNERSTGTGLGLYIVKTAIDALNGKIQVNSKISVGTEFVFSLPYKMMNKSLMV